MKRYLAAKRLWPALLLLTGCIRKELPVKPHDPGNVTTASVNMDPDYKWQVFYSLSANTVVSKNIKTAWDLGFECSADGYHVILNSSRFMFAYRTPQTDFNAVSLSDTAGMGLHRRIDAPSGSLDSTAIGNWRTGNNVYIVDRGYTSDGKSAGMVKIQLSQTATNNYKVRFAALNGSNDTTWTIPKDSTYNFSFLSLDNGGSLVTAEPPKATWDLVFTQYTVVLSDAGNPLPYMVTGCLLNRYQTTAIKDTVNAFSAISYSNVGNYQLTADISTIGYDWKTFGGVTYTVNPLKCYVVHTSSGMYYKLHFIDFYDANNVKGVPKWEFQQL